MRDVRTPSLVGRLVRVRYRDHVLFRNLTRREAFFDRRETVGWLDDRNAKFIIVLHDRSFISAQEEEKEHVAGLVLLRADLEEVKPLD